MGTPPLGQRPLCVLPVVYRLWASVRLGHLQAWFYYWVPHTVFSAGKAVSSVDAWYATALDKEQVLSGACEEHVHLFVADVFISFDTVDRGIPDSAAGRMGGLFRLPCPGLASFQGCCWFGRSLDMGRGHSPVGASEDFF